MMIDKIKIFKDTYSKAHIETIDKLNEIIDVVNSMCDKWDYTPKSLDELTLRAKQMDTPKPDPETESQEHMKKSVTMEDVLIEELKPCTHKWSLHPPGGQGKQVCCICGVERA